MPEMHEDKSKSYAIEKYAVYFINLAASLVFLMVYQLAASHPLKELSFKLNNNFYAALTVYILIFTIIESIITFPVHFYGSYILEHKYDLSNQGLAGWVIDEIKQGMISLIVFIPMINIFYYVIGATGKDWWMWFWLIYFLFTVIFTRVTPSIIIPLFYKYSKIQDLELCDMIKKTAANSGIKLIDVFCIDFSSKTKKANAAIVGIGGSRRMLLTDNLINNFTKDEIEVISGHEFGHHKFWHMWKLIIFSCLATGIGFFILNTVMTKFIVMFKADYIQDFVMFPAFVLVLSELSFIFMPIQNAYSRKLERQADDFAISITGKAGAFISSMEKLAKINLALLTPPKIIKYMFYSHPPISERIEFAREKAVKQACGHI